jgi:hypothetical protein
MLRYVPTIHPNGVKSFLVSIDDRLSFYETLKDSPAMLELIIWKSKITELFGQSSVPLTTEMKMRCRTDSILMIKIIVPNVMSFVTDCDNSNSVANDWSDKDDEDDYCNDDDWSADDDDYRED